MQPEPKPDWGRALRLSRQAFLGSGWQAKVAIAFALLVLVFAPMPFIMPPDSGDPAQFGSVQFAMFAAIIPYVMTAILNAGWRFLPVHQADRRAAAWINVALLPLLVSSVAVAVAGALITAAGKPVAWSLAIALIGVQGTMTGILALALGSVGSWPASMGWFRQASNRRAGDWVVVMVMLVALNRAVFWHPSYAAVTTMGVPLVVAAVILCAINLPIYLHRARLDGDPAKAEQTRYWSLSALEMGGGWKGHLLREIVRAVLLSTVFVACYFVFRMFEASGASDMTPGGRGKPNALLGLVPAFAGVLLSMIGTQRIMQSRRALLALPHGAALMLSVPPIHYAVGFVEALAVMALIDATLPSVGVLAACAVLGLAAALVLFALQLRTVTYAELMVSSVGLGIVAGGIGAMVAIGGVLSVLFADHVSALALGGLVIIAAAQFWALRLTRHSRRPYQPWPASSSRWN